MRPTRLVLITAGLSQPSSTRLLADRITAAVGDRLVAADREPQLTVLELRELAQDITAATLGGGMPSSRLDEAASSLALADAVVAVTPVFTASYSGLFKSFIDVLDPALLRGTPVILAATAGTQRHSLVIDHALRPLFAYLRAVVVPTGVFAATADFGGVDEAGVEGHEALTARIGRAADELVALLTAAEQGAQHGDPGDWAANRHTDELGRAEAAERDGGFTPFEELLRQRR